jgi:hypothetical protein
VVAPLQNTYIAGVFGSHETKPGDVVFNLNGLVTQLAEAHDTRISRAICSLGRGGLSVHDLPVLKRYQNVNFWAERFIRAEEEEKKSHLLNDGGHSALSRTCGLSHVTTSWL